jgi:hypothetical protein
VTHRGAGANLLSGGRLEPSGPVAFRPAVVAAVRSWVALPARPPGRFGGWLVLLVEAPDRKADLSLSIPRVPLEETSPVLALSRVPSPTAGIDRSVAMMLSLP